jgi:hypothetical protein
MKQGASAAAVDTVAFKLGVSSATVEKLGREAGCSSNQGAGLITPVGPVEVYRLRCENGKMLQARCEQRQCKLM